MKKFLLLALAAALLTLVDMTIYGAAQQVLRQSANDPQVQLAEDTATRIGGGARPSDTVSGDSVDIARSLAPFTIIYDKTGLVVASTARLDGVVPKLPDGILGYVSTRSRHTFSWEPKPGVRVAAVMVPSAQGYVLVGRSLREVERREAGLGLLIGVSWLLSLILAALIYGVHALRLPRAVK